MPHQIRLDHCDRVLIEFVAIQFTKPPISFRAVTQQDVTHLLPTQVRPNPPGPPHDDHRPNDNLDVIDMPGQPEPNLSGTLDRVLYGLATGDSHDCIAPHMRWRRRVLRLDHKDAARADQYVINISSGPVLQTVDQPPSLPVARRRIDRLCRELLPHPSKTPPVGAGDSEDQPSHDAKKRCGEESDEKSLHDRNHWDDGKESHTNHEDPRKYC